MGAELPLYQRTVVDDYPENPKDSPCYGCSSDKRKSKCSRVMPVRYDLVGDEAPNTDGPVDLLVVADTPSEDDEQKGSFFKDEEGKEVLRSIKALGFKSFVVTPAVRCYPGQDVDHFVLKKKYKGGEAPRFSKTKPLDVAKEALQACKAFTQNLVDSYQPTMTLAMGPLATEALSMKGSIPFLRARIHKPTGLAGLKVKAGTVVTHDRFMTKRSPWAKQDFKYDLQKLHGIATTGIATPRGDKDTIQVITLDTVKKVKDFVSMVLTTKWDPTEIWSFDFETENTSMNTEVNRILNMGFSRRYDENTAYVIPYAHPETPFSPEELEVIAAELRRLFQSIGASFYAWLAHAAQFEVKMIKLFFGVWLGEDGDIPVLDTGIFAYLLDEDRKAKGISKEPLGLETLALEFLGFTWYSDVKIKSRRDRLSEEPLERVNEYVGVDAAVTARLFNLLLERSIEEGPESRRGSDADLLRLARYLYSAATNYTSDLTITGQPVNKELLRKLRGQDSSIVKRLEEIDAMFQQAPEVQQALEVIQNGLFGGQMKPAFGLTRQRFLLTTPQHKKALFWDVLELSGADESVDKKFQERHANVPLVKLYNEFQGLSKLDSSYLEPIATFLHSPNSVDGRLRPRFKLNDTSTGRLAGADPNSQNMPRGDTRDKKQVKALFIAGIGYVLVQLDFSQAEVRWLGVLSGDEALAEKYRVAMEIDELLLKDPDNKELKKRKKLDGDLHMSTAIAMYNLDPSIVFTDEKKAKAARQKAKAVCFGLIYGKSARALAADLGIELEEAEEAVERWLSQFPQARAWLRQTEREAERYGFVRSPFGRWRRLPETASDDISVRNRAFRQARNTPIQSAASDCCIYAACKLRKALQKSPIEGLRRAKLINTVHDSLVAEVPADIEVVRAYTQLARGIFTDPDLLLKDFGIKITVPMAVDFDIGVNWGAMRDYDFSEESLLRAMYDAEVMRTQPAGNLFEDAEALGLCYDQAVLGKPLPKK